MSDKSSTSETKQPKKNRRWKIAALAMCGVFFGISGFTFHYAEGTSYLSNDPKACVNCHIMRPQYEGWQKGSHHSFATCNDCHLPHDFVGKWYCKAENGYLHSKAFTLQNFKEPIEMRPVSKQILEQSCLYCHKDFVHATASTADSTDFSCLHCHRSVGHGDSVGLGKFDSKELKAITEKAKGDNG